MPRALSGIAVLILVALISPQRVVAQDSPENPPLRVFLECIYCDFDFVRTEVQYVDWMRDRADADLHVIARVQSTGGGGQQHLLDFTGLKRHTGQADTLYYYADRDDTDDTTRRGLLRVLSMGLMRYLADTPVANQLQVRLLPAPTTAVTRPVASTRDPWNAWVFTMSASGSSNGESSRNSSSLRASFGANRTTANWKTTFSGSGNYGRQSNSYTIGGKDTTSVLTTESSSGTLLIARSLNGHTSLGLRSSMGTSTVNNAKVFLRVSPAIEYNIFPYTETTRRALLFEYSIGMMTQRYREETIFFLMDETRPTHALSASYNTRARWGTARVDLDGSQFLHDTDLYNLRASGQTSMNLVRGFSLTLSGSYTRVRDQITLARRQLTEEEVLLRQRTIATGFLYSSSISLSYRFGSAVQNVVNSRFAL